MNNEILQTLKNLIEIPSISNDIEQCEKIIDYVKNTYSKYHNANISIHTFDNYPSIIIWNFDWKDADIILNGHVDVVPASEQGQFKYTESEGKIFARWSWDMKAGIAIMMQIMQDIFESQYTDKKILLIINTDEEIWGENGAKKIVELGYTWKAVLVPDSWDSNTIVIAEKWILDLEVEVTGTSCHASRPWLWDNAIEKTYKLYGALRDMIQNNQALSAEWNWWSSVNLTKIQAWSVTNVIPNTCKAFFDIRVTEAFENMGQLQKEIETLVQSYDAKILLIFRWDLVYTDPNETFVSAYIESYKTIMWKDPFLSKEHWASDGRYFASKKMPLLLQRPTCANIHSKNEWVDIKSIEEIYQIYKHFIFENSFWISK